ncbi:MAG: UDP-N-acetylmuramate--L-alanine ligase, partial [Desulfococcaceae bacterium]
TTSMMGLLLIKGGFDPTVVIGGKLKNLGSNAVLGGGDFLVAEADESDGSFLKMTPTLAVVTNIDREHLDFYEDLEAIKTVFLDFIDRVPFYGAAILCLDSEPVQELIPRVGKRFATYGLSSQADFQARNLRHEGLCSRFSLYRHGEPLGEILLNLPGRHNVLNATAAVAVGAELDIPFSEIKAALETIDGVQRRMEVKGEAGGVTVVDDYGHHPTEIKTTLEAARACWPDRRLVVAFQPHRYTRTRDLFNDFTRSFYQSDLLRLLPIYSAGETPIEGVTAEALYEGIQRFGHKDVVFLADSAEALNHFDELLRPGDVFLTLGAGNVWRTGESVLARLRERHGR